MYPKLYNSSGVHLATLDNIIKDSAEVERTVNGPFIFSFEALEAELKSEYFASDSMVLVEDQFFDVKYVEQLHSDDIRYTIQCEHVNYRLEDGSENLYPTYAYTGTPTQILTNILSGTEFSVGTVDFTAVITISVDQEITRKSLIYQLANLLGGEIEYTNNGFTLNVLNTIGKDDGFQIRFGKNMLGVKKIIDRRGELKTYYTVDLVELKNSEEYIRRGLQDLESVGVGDTVTLIDEVIGLNVQNRIVSITYNPIFAMNTKLEIANKLELISDKIFEVETLAKAKEYGAVQLDEPYNMTTISFEYGVRSTRSDLKARSTLGGGTLHLESGDGGGSYSDALYFDATAGKYKFIGDIDATGTITGVELVGGTINIGGGVFTVDSLGHVVANSISIGSGASGISNFSDAGALATLDSISGTYIDDNSITTPKLNVSTLSAITANLGTVTAGTLTGVSVTSNSFTAHNRIDIDSSNSNDGLYFTGTYSGGYMRGGLGNVILGPDVFVADDLWVQDLIQANSIQAGASMYVGGSQVATQSDLSGFATSSQLSSLESYTVKDYIAQGIEMQFFSNHIEVRSSAYPTWRAINF
ncbi:MAG: hypothetical protein PHX43_03795 [Alphaproteobacteria bacterium]|nr:hypothetical protein [Alphaproteobacteria bacterium]